MCGLRKEVYRCVLSFAFGISRLSHTPTSTFKHFFLVNIDFLLEFNILSDFCLSIDIQHLATSTLTTPYSYPKPKVLYYVINRITQNSQCLHQHSHPQHNNQLSSAEADTTDQHKTKKATQYQINLSTSVEMATTSPSNPVPRMKVVGVTTKTLATYHLLPHHHLQHNSKWRLHVTIRNFWEFRNLRREKRFIISDLFAIKQAICFHQHQLA